MTNGTQDELRRAAQCDAAGEHDQAINALARATQLGDVEAMTQLGKRLVVGDRAPLLPRDGVRFLLDAMRAGGAEAPARVATLAALGLYVEQGLQDALDLLIVAAERGWAAAGDQLRALAGVAPGDDAAVARSDWRALSSSIDLGFWAAAVAGVTLSAAPLVQSFDGLLPFTVCDWLIERSRTQLKRALVYDAVGGREIADHTRTNTVAQFDLMGTELLHLLVQMRMSAACRTPIANMEATAVLHYDVGEEITNHFDFVNPRVPNYTEEIARNGQRMLTFLIYLNDDYDGGETEFPRLGIRHKGRRGEGLLFINALEDGSPDLRTVHAGRPPMRGEKWVVSQFVRNRRVLGAPA